MVAAALVSCGDDAQTVDSGVDGRVGTAGITVTPTSGLVTNESGATATFTVVLDGQPSANVTIALSSSEVAEGTPDPATLTFTSASWNAPQTVTVTGVDDNAVDGDRTYSIVVAPSQSADAAFNNLDGDDVSVVNVDNDSAGVTVTPTTGLTVTEAGQQATFTVVLNTQPTADVTIPLTSSAPDEGTVSPASVTFTAANWNAPQTVTITGIDDAQQDGATMFQIQLAAATSTDDRYNGLDADDVSVTNTDNDMAGITVMPVSGLVTRESGETATFTVVLNSQPTEMVSIGLTSSNPAEGTVAPASLVFTTMNWNAPQTVTVTGVDDAVAVEDGNQVYTIVTAPSQSADPLYANLDASDVAVTNFDDDMAGFVVTPTTLSTTEGGATATFTVRLTTRPTANVSIGVTSSNTAEGTVAPAALAFTSANWNQPQTVTVTGVDDNPATADGDQPYTIVLAAATSSDMAYNGKNPPDVAATNVDNDSAGIRINPTSGLVTTESGGTATFTVVLTTQPTATVAIGLSSSNTAEGSVAPASVSFTTASWNVPQTVTVTGVNDNPAVVDGNQPYQIVTAPATSTDARYAGIDPTNVSVTNNDNDVPAITVTPTAITTTEAGGTATFTVVLGTRPAANVTVGLTSSDTSEGTVAPASVTFTTASWNVPQTVTVTGVDDPIDDDNVAYQIVTAAATSTDPDYNGLDAANVNATNTDNDAAGFTVAPTAGLVTTEAGGTATFTIRLNTQPTGNVAVALSSSDTTEGTVAPASVTFTTASWNQAQTVTVTGVDDAIDDGNVAYQVVTAAATSSDTKYSGLDPANVGVTNNDDADTAGVLVAPTTGLVVTEAGATATFSIALASQPRANVTIALSSSDTTEGTVAPASVTFAPSTWNMPQTVTVTGVDDDVDDGNRPFTIVTGAAASADAGYNGLAVADVAASNTDDDTAGIDVQPTTGLRTTEAGGTATFTVRLTSQPTANVSIGLSSNDPSEGTVSAAALTFTAASWSTPQTVTVTGVNDSFDDGDRAYTIVTAAATSSDATYNGQNGADVSVTNVDNDAAGFTVTPTSGLVTTENGGASGSDTFTIVLQAQPTANVTIGLSSSDPNEGTVSPASVTFTTASWNAPQTVTVTGVNDAIVDGPQTYRINTSAATSADPAYSGLGVPDVTDITNIDNDGAASVEVSPTSGLVTREGEPAATATFTVRLGRQPTNNVTIALASSDTTEGTVAPASLTFTSANWNTAQTVTATGVDDAAADGNQSYTITTGAASSADPRYNGFAVADVSVTNIDNETSGVTVTPQSGLVTTESGGTATFTVRLNRQPSANVTIDLTSNDTTEGSVAPAQLTFTAMNWDDDQTVTVTGVNDAVADGDVLYVINTANAVSTDPTYFNLTVPDVSVTNIDNEAPGITLTMCEPGATRWETRETAPDHTDCFRMRLNSQPTANVDVDFVSSDTTEATVTASITFTSTNWNVDQTVTITGVNDNSDDGDQPYRITGTMTSTDASYNNRALPAPLDVAPTSSNGLNRDDDTAGFLVTPTSGLVTTEAGGTATFTVRLASQPTANVTIALSSSDTTEGTVSPSSLTFTSASWNTAQTVTLTGVNDAIDDGNVVYTVLTGNAVSTDGDYSGLDPANVSATNNDDADAAGFTIAVSPAACGTGSDTTLETTEAGGTDCFTIRLNSQPVGTVVVDFAPNAAGSDEIAINPTAVSFNDTNWNATQQVVVRGLDDQVDDGNIAYTVVTSVNTTQTTDATYDPLNPADVTGTNADNDANGVTASAVTGTATEAGGTATFTVSLTAQPTGTVTVPLTSQDTTEGTVSPTSLTFTAANWSTPQTVTVRGVDDAVDDGNQTFTVTVGPANGGGYSNQTPAQQPTVTNADDDTAGFEIVYSPAPCGRGTTTLVETTEAGISDCFAIRLVTEPQANVTVSFSSSDPTEGTVAPTQVTFTAQNYNAFQVVQVTGVDDALPDGPQSYTVVTAPAVSSGDDYSGLDAPNVSASNADND